MPEMMNIAHRGASAYETDNSMASFQKAIEMGAEMLEMDVHLTKNRKVVVIHDDSIKNATGKKGKISEMPFVDVQKLRLKDGQEIPTLKDVLERFKGQCQFNIEIKSLEVALPSFDIVKKLDILDDVLFSCFNGLWLVGIKAKQEKARIAIISRDKKINLVQLATNLKAEAIHPEKKILTKELIENAQKEGLKINVWVVDKEPAMKKFIDMGVDGIITNKPDILSKLLCHK